VIRALHPGWSGNLRWALKAGLLKVSVQAATALFTYNGALVAQSATRASGIGIGKLADDQP